VASSSASALSSQINIDLLPVLSQWTDTPQKSQADNAVSKVKGILPFAENLLVSLGGDPTGGKGDCTGKKRGIPNPFKIAGDIIKAVSCVVNTLNKVTSSIEGGLKDAVDDVKSEIEGLKPITSDLENDEGKDDDESSTETDETSTNTESKTSSQTSSSSSCSKTVTTQDIYVQCFASTISGTSSQVIQVCTTATSTVTGGDCSITAFTTTSTSSATQSLATSIGTVNDEPLWTGSVTTMDFSLALLYESRLDAAVSGRYATITPN
jgi:hypothetical protein